MNKSIVDSNITISPRLMGGYKDCETHTNKNNNKPLAKGNYKTIDCLPEILSYDIADYLFFNEERVDRIRKIRYEG